MRYPLVKQALKPRQMEDGIFWLSKDEFFEHFSTVYLCAKDMSEFIEDAPQTQQFVQASGQLGELKKSTAVRRAYRPEKNPEQQAGMSPWDEDVVDTTLANFDPANFDPEVCARFRTMEVIFLTLEQTSG